MWSQKLETQDPDDPKTGRVKKRERDRLRVWDADETFAQHARMAGWRGVDNVVILSVQSKRLCTCPFSEKQGSTASRTSMRQRPTCWIRISLPFRKVFQEQKFAANTTCPNFKTKNSICRSMYLFFLQDCRTQTTLHDL